MNDTQTKDWRGRRQFLAGGATLVAATAAHPLLGAQPAESTAPGAVGRIDVHSHYLPERYRQALIKAGHSKPSGMPAIPKWSVEEHIGMMDRNGIDAAIISISAPGLHFGDDAAARDLARHVNEEGARAKQTYPKRFGLFASLPLPDVEGSLKEIAYAFDVLKADGVVLESNYKGIYLGDKRLDPVFAELHRRGAKIFLHPTNPHCPCCQSADELPPTGYPFPMIEFMFETTRAAFKLMLSGTLIRYPNIQLIIPHAGATIPVLADRVAMFSAAFAKEGEKPDIPGFYKTLRSFYYDLAGFPVPRQLPSLLELADPKRILYGSDWPFTPEGLVKHLAKQLDSTPLIEARLREDFMRNNALTLFPDLKRN